MKTCGDGCAAICDFCVYCSINSDKVNNYNNCWCYKHRKFVSLLSDCDDFYCFHADGAREVLNEIAQEQKGGRTMKEMIKNYLNADGYKDFSKSLAGEECSLGALREYDEEAYKDMILSVLQEHGWEVTNTDGGDLSEPEATATRRWNLAEVNSDGDYKSFITDLKADIIDPLYIEYTLDLANERASYIYYPGGETGANCGEIEDDFAACLEAALEDTLFTPTKYPLRTVDVLRSDDKLRPCWFDLVQFTDDYSSCLFSAGAGSFAIRVQNNTNVRSDEPNEYFFISEEDASGILKEKEKESIDRIVDMMARIVDKVSERS